MENSTIRHEEIYADLSRRLSNAWHSIKQRCYNPNSRAYKWYGGRGVRIADAWANDYAAFKLYMVTLPNSTASGLSIDRVDNDGNYEPGNVRWATPVQQACNSRNYKKGASSERLYHIWSSAKTRHCQFGGFHPAWINDYHAFRDYVTSLPDADKPKASLCLISRAKNFEPNNLYWR